MAKNQTPINCLDGNNADHYTPIAVEILLFKQKDNNGNELIMYLNKKIKIKRIKK